MKDETMKSHDCCAHCSCCERDQLLLDDYGRLGTGTTVEALVTAVVMLAVMVPIFLVTGHEFPQIDWQRPELPVFLGLFGGLFVACTLVQLVSRRFRGRR